MATIIEMITAIVMLTPEDANLLKTTHPAPIQKTSIKTIPHPEIFSFILIYNSIFKYHSAKYKRKKRRPNRHPTQLLSTQDKREMFRYSGYNNRSYRPFDFILAVLSIGDFREPELAYAR